MNYKSLLIIGLFSCCIANLTLAMDDTLPGPGPSFSPRSCAGTSEEFNFEECIGYPGQSESDKDDNPSFNSSDNSSDEEGLSLYEKFEALRSKPPIIRHRLPIKILGSFLISNSPISPNNESPQPPKYLKTQKHDTNSKTSKQPPQEHTKVARENLNKVRTIKPRPLSASHESQPFFHSRKSKNTSNIIPLAYQHLFKNQGRRGDEKGVGDGEVYFLKTHIKFWKHQNLMQEYQKKGQEVQERINARLRYEKEDRWRRS